MKTTIWKSDLNIFFGLSTFIVLWKNQIKEFKNFYVFTGDFDPYHEIPWILPMPSSKLFPFGKNN